MIQELITAEHKAAQLFAEIERRGYFEPGITEKDLNDRVFDLADEMFGIRKYWHKRIVRAGKNTLLPYRENPENLTLRDDEIIFLDFGPVFDEWEADFGRTYVIGNNADKLRLKQDVEDAWYEGQKYFVKHQNELTGASFYRFTQELAVKYKWEFGNLHCGHLVGNFPHERILGDEINNYFHRDNEIKVSDLDILGQPRYWIYEMHLVNREKEIGGFFEQLVSVV